MGLFIRQNDNRSEFQERLAADLRERAKLQANGGDPLDPTKQSNYIKDTEMTAMPSPKWLAVVGILLIGVVLFAVTR